MIGFVALGIVMLIWVLTWDSGSWTKARYIPPPEL